jgi:acetyl-CoA carboxylase biotin carboxyl carrier protein
MGLSHDDVQRLLQLLDASQFDELQLESDGVKLLLRRGGAGDVVSPPAAPMPEHHAPDAPPPAPADPPAATPGLVDVRAPMLGTWYAAPRPGAAPFVAVGQAVEADSAIGIIEVMKLMNSIVAGVAGTVVEVLVRDGQFVEFDQALLRVRPAGAEPS